MPSPSPTRIYGAGEEDGILSERNIINSDRREPLEAIGSHLSSLNRYGQRGATERNKQLAYYDLLCKNLLLSCSLLFLNTFRPSSLRTSCLLPTNSFEPIHELAPRLIVHDSWKIVHCDSPVCCRAVVTTCPSVPAIICARGVRATSSARRRPVPHIPNPLFWCSSSLCLGSRRHGTFPTLYQQPHLTGTAPCAGVTDSKAVAESS
jgi:hypothetical protein